MIDVWSIRLKKLLIGPHGLLGLVPPAEVLSPETPPDSSQPWNWTFGVLPGTPLGRAPADELPPSARVVLDALAGGPRTYRDLVAATSLAGRTVRWAVRRLRNDGLVTARASLRDGRVTWFFLSPPRPVVRTRVL